MLQHQTEGFAEPFHLDRKFMTSKPFKSREIRITPSASGRMEVRAYLAEGHLVVHIKLGWGHPASPYMACADRLEPFPQAMSLMRTKNTQQCVRHGGLLRTLHTLGQW